jgi:hypothetical protein
VEGACVHEAERPPALEEQRWLEGGRQAGGSDPLSTCVGGPEKSCSCPPPVRKAGCSGPPASAPTLSLTPPQS